MQLPIDITDLVLPSGRGRTLNLPGGAITYNVTSEAEDGAWSLVECVMPPYGIGLPPHCHRETTEALYVIQGSLALTLGDVTTMAGPGAYVVVEPGVRHSLFNPTASPVCYLLWLSPGRLFEQCCEELGALMADGSWSSAREDMLRTLGHKYDMYDLVVER